MSKGIKIGPPLLLPIPHPGDGSLESLDVLASATACAVTNISFCLQQPDHFLMGCSDGSIRLHHIKRGRSV